MQSPHSSVTCSVPELDKMIARVDESLQYCESPQDQKKLRAHHRQLERTRDPDYEGWYQDDVQHFKGFDEDGNGLLDLSVH